MTFRKAIMRNKKWGLIKLIWIYNIMITLARLEKFGKVLSEVAGRSRIDNYCKLGGCDFGQTSNVLI